MICLYSRCQQERSSWPRRRQSGQLHYANAGHEPPYRRYDGSVTELWATGMPPGMMPGTRYDEYEAILAPGGSLLFYSDGLVEAHNARRDMFGVSTPESLDRRTSRRYGTHRFAAQ
ncbi:MAG: PP2C family protein-serine/threonine phosphatase [Ktedonobacteraceae bacterium]